MGDLLRVTAPSGLKLRPEASTDEQTSAAIFLMPIGTIVETQGQVDAAEPHFVNVYVDLTQTTMASLPGVKSEFLDQGLDGYSGFASADWLQPTNALPQPGPSPTPGPGPTPSPPAPSAGMSTGAKVALGALALVVIWYVVK